MKNQNRPFNNQFATLRLREEVIDEMSVTGAGEATLPRWTGPKKKTNETIKSVDGKYAVYPKKGGKRLGTHDTKEKAQKQLAAIEISKSKNEALIPKDWKAAPSIPNRPSKGGFIYKKLFENMTMSDVELDYPEFYPEFISIIEKVADYLGTDIQEFQSAQYKVGDEYIEIFMPQSEKTIMIDMLPGGKLRVNTSGPVSSMQTVIDEEEKLPEEGAEIKVTKKGSPKDGQLGKIVSITEPGAYNVSFNGTIMTFQETDFVVTKSAEEQAAAADSKSSEDSEETDTEAGGESAPEGGEEDTGDSEDSSSSEELKEYLKENYSRFKKETRTRTNEQQLHAAMRLAEKKIHEANRILEYTSKLRGELNETKANKNTQKLMEKIKKGIAEAYGKMKNMGAVPMKKQDFFGMAKQDFDALIAASDRKRYRPSPDKIALVKTKFPKISDQEAEIALKLLNSPAQDTFTRYDVMDYLQKYR